MSDPQLPSSTTRRTSTMAIVSLLCALFGWSVLPLIGSLVAIVTGHMARAEIRRSPQTIAGDGLAVAGLVLGYASVATAVALALALFLFFGGLATLFAFASHWS